MTAPREILDVLRKDLLIGASLRPKGFAVLGKIQPITKVGGKF